MDENPGLMEDMSIVIAWRFYNESVASLYQAKLADANIQSFLSNQHTSNLIPFGDGGILLHVKKLDLERSVEIIKATHADFLNRPKGEFYDADLGDIEYEKSVLSQEERLTNANKISFKSTLILVVLGLILAFLISYLTNF
jgi:hypothetical protein